MADKTTASGIGQAPTQANVSTAGSIAAGSVTIVFDDASSLLDLEASLEKASIQMRNYFLKR